MKTSSSKQRSSAIQISLFYGLIGGVLLIVLNANVADGYVQMLPYPVIMLMAGFALNNRMHGRGRLLRQVLGGWLTFVLMTAFVYGYMVTYGEATESSAWYHIIRILALLAGGILASYIVALLVRWIQPVGL